MEHYLTYVNKINNALHKVMVTSDGGKTLSPETGVSLWCDMTAELQAKGKTMFFVGNGASAMMASHMAADASKTGGIRSIAFNDAALLTAVSNDISYEQSFAFPLRQFATPGDILVTISSSGNSPNIIASIQTAHEMGTRVVTLSGMKSNNQSRQLGNLNFYVPADTYGFVEICHQAILHCWLDRYMETSRDKG